MLVVIFGQNLLKYLYINNYFVFLFNTSIVKLRHPRLPWDPKSDFVLYSVQAHPCHQDRQNVSNFYLMFSEYMENLISKRPIFIKDLGSGGARFV